MVLCMRYIGVLLGIASACDDCHVLRGLHTVLMPKAA